MGQPVFRFQLSNSTYGTLEISEPDGWKDAKLRLERHPDFWSLIEYFEGSFIFYGDNGVDNGGWPWIKDIESSQGVDAEINITIDISFNDGDDFENIFTGQLDLSGIQEMPNNKAEIPIIRNDFWSNFINRRDTEVNLKSTTSLDGGSIPVIDGVDVDLPPQILRTKYLHEQDEGEYSELDGIGYWQFTPNGAILDETETVYSLGFSLNPSRPVWWLEAEYAGTYDLSFRIEISQMVLTGPLNYVLSELVSGGLTSPTTFVFQKNDDTPINFTRVDNVASYNGTNIYSCWDDPPGGGVIALGSTVFSYATVIQLKKGDLLRIYLNRTTGVDNIKAVVWGKNGIPCMDLSFLPKDQQSGRPPLMADIPTYFSVIADTVFPESSAEAFLIHDAGAAITDRIIGRQNTFYSEYFGSYQTNARSYISDGCGWEAILIQGLQLRGYTLEEKRAAISFNKWWNGANPVYNLSLSYDTISGQEVIRVEPKEYVFDRTISVYIDNVQAITREYDNENIFKKIELGYEKWQSEDISGIDDPQTRHSYATRFKKVGSTFSSFSAFIAASYAIEITRRQTVKKSKDYKFDNDTFIISIKGDDVSPDRYIVALNERFNVVNNLLHYETRYNLDLTVDRNFLRWQNFLNGGLQAYQASSYKFIYGEGNYDMSSKMVVSTPGCNDDYNGLLLEEGGDIPVTNDYLFIPKEFKIEIDLSWDDYVTIRSNRTKAIGISQTETDHRAFFIKLLEYEVTRSKATLTLWPADDFNIQVPEFVIPDRPCFANSGDETSCATALTDSSGQILTDSSGECIYA